MVSETIVQWISLARNRSLENQSAMNLLFANRNRTGCFGVLRQELDTLIRALFLLAKSPNERERLVGQTLRGERWTHAQSKRVVTDREMAELANQLHGWATNVYKFGCAFIHLSDLHSAEEHNLSEKLEVEEVDSIRAYVLQYHGIYISDDLALGDLFAISDKIFEKIRSNLECYLEDLENGVTGPVL